MSDDRLRRASFDNTDADAVCEMCGTVNPEGTLLCKQCGNNLRDQRARRIAIEADTAIGSGGLSARDWVRGIVVMIGLLLIVWTAFNTDTIVDWFTPQVADDAPVEDFWRGPEAEPFEELYRTLAADPVLETSPRMPGETSERMGLGDGRYAIEIQPEEDEEAVFGGGAIAARAENGDFLFVALLRGGGEIRGRAQIESSGSAASMNAAVRLKGRDVGAFGYVEPNAVNKNFMCFAQTKSSDKRYAAALYRVE